VADVIAAGIIPAGLEMMDKPATAAVEEFVKAGYDLDAAAILLCESDGTPEEVAEESPHERGAARIGATRITVSQSEAERLRFWSGRKNAFPAAGRISPDYYCMDGTIPRKHIGTLLKRIEQMEQKYGLRCINVFHAGDGNMHPLILFDGAIDEWHRAELFGADILETCVELGGTVTGEHGVGVEKLNSMCVQFSRPSARRSSASRPRSIRPAAEPGQGHPTLRAAPNTARCTSSAACCRIRTCRVSDTIRRECAHPASSALHMSRHDRTARHSPTAGPTRVGMAPALVHDHLRSGHAPGPPFDIVLLAAIVASVAVVMLDSIRPSRAPGHGVHRARGCSRCCSRPNTSCG
jgi:hypothetical protein